MSKQDISCFQLPPEDEAAVLAAYAAMTAEPACVERLDRARALFFETGKDFVPEVTAAGEAVGVHRFTAALAFLLTCTDRMHELYREHGYPESLYRDGLADIGTKAAECKRVHGVVGIFVLWWYPDLFRCRRFLLGRLEYEVIAFPRDSYRDILKKGAPVLNCHIPSAGSLPQEAVLDSLKRAYAFYPELRHNGILPVYCHSWLFYPPMAALYKPGSNLDRFYRNFEILSEEALSPEVNFWRVFDRPWSPEALETAPEQTSLQRSLKRHLQAGGQMGCAEVILLFDGERILEK